MSLSESMRIEDTFSDLEIQLLIRDLMQPGQHQRGQRLRQCSLIDCITVFQSEFEKSFVSCSVLVEFTHSLHFFAT